MLTPLDLETRTFTKKFGKYKAEEVDEFMTALRIEYEKLYKENLALKDKVAMLSDAIKQYKSMEDTLQSAIIVAQNTGEEVKRNAYTKAENIINDAELKASTLISDAGKEVTRINYQFEEMKRSVEIYRAKMVSLISSQMDILKGFDPSDIEAELVHEPFDMPEIKEEPAKEAEVPEIDVEEVIEKIKRDTMELPKIVMNENGEYVPADEIE
ncbi:MAG: DivIVA domain-containing protein [Clostridia bacterium]|nr:DivIVA domain-containing protein [Clostridia bacterium]